MSAVEYTVNEKFSTTSFADQRKITSKPSMAKFTSVLMNRATDKPDAGNKSTAVVPVKADDDEDVFVAVTSRVSLAVDEYCEFLAPKKTKRRAPGNRAFRKFLEKLTA
mmetsp:Transcript_12524/g.33774  ORF Transcript_12524/g.33774 Transcript_12524/m.33774 type:complete len:108 (-) Transcript_12524:133-456(-)